MQPSDCIQSHLALIMEKHGDRGQLYKKSLANSWKHVQNICPCPLPPLPFQDPQMEYILGLDLFPVDLTFTSNILFYFFKIGTPDSFF